MKNLLWIFSLLLTLQTSDLFGSTTPLHNKKNNPVGASFPSYKILKEQYGIKLKWHQRIKYSILKLSHGRQVQDEEKKIKRAKTFGLASLIAGILGIVLLWIVPEAGLLLAVAAIIGGIASLGRNPKKGTSIAAIIIGGSTVLFGLVAWLIFLKTLFGFL